MRTKNTTKLDALYLTFHGFQYQGIYTRSALVLNFKYETVLDEREPRVDCVVCIVLDRDKKNIEKSSDAGKADQNNAGLNHGNVGLNDNDAGPAPSYAGQTHYKNGESTSWSPEDEDPKNLVWGLITAINTDMCSSKMCCVEMLPEITALDPHQVLLKLTTLRKPALGFASNKFYVNYTIVREMKFLDTDLNEELVPVLLDAEESDNSEPHYLITKDRLGEEMRKGIVEEAGELNAAQADAMRWCVGHKVAVVQGPPGE